MIRHQIEITFLNDDKVFAAKVQKVLNEHLTNSSFNTQMFCEQMHISRAQLHRKLKASTGYSTSAFIHHQRIKASRELLKGLKANVAVIARGVGYNDPSYFSKVFKKIVGCTPTVYIQKS